MLNSFQERIKTFPYTAGRILKTLRHDGFPFKVEFCKLNGATEKALAEDDKEDGEGLFDTAEEMPELLLK